MPQHRHEQDQTNESAETIVGRFTDSRSAELAAGAALKHGFAVQLLDSTTVAVRPGSRPQHAGEVEGMLAAYGATNMPGVRPARGQPTDGSAPQRVRAEQGGRLELVEEELQAQTRPVAAGEVLIRKRIVNETVTIEVPVQREELLLERLPVERQPFDRPGVAAADPLVQALSDRLRQMQPGEALRVPVVEEEVIVHKQPVVRSEVIIGKRLVREIQHFSDTVRREVAEVEPDGQVRIAEKEQLS
jgi:uncharacterized protein (TIGR02271 family)